MTRVRTSLALSLSEPAKAPTRSKYGNKKTVIDGLAFDSKREALRWLLLRTEEIAGEITNLRRQIRYPLKVNGKLVTTYVADFVYERDGATVVEDAKGHRTREYINKAKLFEAIHGFPIREV